MNAKSPRQVTRVINEKTPEKIHPKTLLIAALTAVTVASISLQLTGLVSSITLIALASLLTAFVSEFYRVGLELFQKAVARSVEKTLLRYPASAEGPLLPPEETVSEEPEVVEEPAPQASPPSRPLKARARSALASRWAAPALFALIAFGTVAASYGVGQFAETPTTVNRNVVQVKDLSKEREAQLQAAAKDEALKAARQQAAQALEDASSESSELVNLTREELVTLITTLEEALAAEQEANREQNSTLEEQAATLEELRQALAELQERQAAIEEEQAQAPTPAPLTPQSPASVPSPAIVEE